MDPASIMVLVVAGSLGFAAAGGALWYQSSLAKRRDAAWRSVAAIRRGRFTEGKVGLFVFEPPTIDVIVEHAVVRADLIAVQSGRNKHLYTRARARFALGAGPAFKVYREGVLQSVGKAFGGQDIELGGDDRFDDHFMVKCDDVEGTRAAWTPNAKVLMWSHFDGARVESDGSAVVLTVFGAIDDEARLESMLDLVGALASTGAGVLAGYRSLEGARWTPTKGPFADPSPPRLTVDTPRGEVAVEVLALGGGPRVRLRIAHGRPLPPFSVDVTGAEGPGLPRGLVSERADAMLRRLSGITLAGDGTTLQITWRGAPPPEQLAEGVALIVELAGGAPSEGAFR